MTATEPTTSEPLDLAEVAAILADNGIDGPDLPYNPRALAAMRSADALLAEVERLRAVIDRALAVGTNSLDGDGRVRAHEARGDQAWIVFYAGAQMAFDRMRIELGGEVSW